MAETHRDATLGLDVNVGRYYEPRERVIVIHRDARPIEHYANVSNVRVIVGPPRSVLVREHVYVRPVRGEARTIGRWPAAQAKAQVVRAQEHRATFEVQNQRRVDGNVRIHEAHTRVLEAHPQLKVEVNQRRLQAGDHGAEHREAPVKTVEHGPSRPAEPARAQPSRPVEHAQPPRPAEPRHVEPSRRVEPAHSAAPPPPVRSHREREPHPTRGEAQPAAPAHAAPREQKEQKEPKEPKEPERH